MTEIITSTKPTSKTSITKKQIKAAGLKTFADTTQVMSSFPEHIQEIAAAYILGMIAGSQTKISEKEIERKMWELLRQQKSE